MCVRFAVLYLVCILRGVEMHTQLSIFVKIFTSVENNLDTEFIHAAGRQM